MKRINRLKWIIALAILTAGCGSRAGTELPSTHAPLSETPPQAAHTQPAQHPTPAAQIPTVPAGAETIARYDVYELEFPWPSANYSNPWEQVQITGTFTAPSGKIITIGGFYYAADLWRARFSPGETGNWNWTARLTDSV